MVSLSLYRITRASRFALCVASVLLASCMKSEMPVMTEDDVFQNTAQEERVSSEPAIVLPAPEGPAVKVHATFKSGPETRSSLVDEGENLSVTWSSGDVFHANFEGENGKFFDAEFVTSSSGPSVEFTTEALLEGQSFFCFYPGYLETQIDDKTGVRACRVELPKAQDAVAGGIANGVNLSYAYADKITENSALVFRNIPSLIRFKLAGSIADEIVSVSLKATYNVCGDAYIANDQGKPTLYPIRDNASHRYPEVVLNGSFEAGKDYYIAVLPGTTHGFEMTFNANDGRYSTYRSSKTITFSRSEVEDFGEIDLGSTFVGSGNISTEPVQYMSATEGTKPATIAIVPEGFTLKELPQYERYAKMAIDYLFETEPFKTYKRRFNVYILKVASAESGVSITDDNDKVITRVNTYFKIKRAENTYGNFKPENDKHSNVTTFVETNCPDIVSGIHTIDEVPILVLVNDYRYGAMTWFYSLGWAYSIVPIVYNGGLLKWPYSSITAISDSDPDSGYRETTEEERREFGITVGDWRNAVTHELGGHAFGRLTDEYWSQATKANTKTIQDRQNWTVPYGLNISVSYTNPPWKILLDRRDDLIKKDSRYERIGVFQGAYGYAFNAWRSEKVSCMMENRPYFSAWQRYLIVQRIFTLSGDSSKFTFEKWLENDVTIDPVRDIETKSGGYGYDEKDALLVPPFAPPGSADQETDYE